ncbi:uncharacterized protein LOC124480053 isoform X1 [Hypomesus transpacificus]|uniref:uncharacterized protein LOC124480053 isoform X1 n=1 Tax=Hypomesus transpacificus TaxID=137520 RepID=UPI001F07BAB3|nr:uncharacterized protein LOC124480053 isoform X1 [Hypomesus transpacificus]XP_046895067.1 uncharacterized protein LOC124480053 isoform X1 [Hypomesus transpacificus]
MAGQQSPAKYLLLQVWCGLLTVGMIVLAAIFTSMKINSTDKNNLSTPDPEKIAPNAVFAALNSSKGPQHSYIQLTMANRQDTWTYDTYHNMPLCESCSLTLDNNCVLASSDGLYYFYAHVTFHNLPEGNEKGTVSLYRYATSSERRKLSEAVFRGKQGTVSIAKIVQLKKENCVRLEITPNNTFISHEVVKTFWGAYQLPKL